MSVIVNLNRYSPSMASDMSTCSLPISVAETPLVSRVLDVDSHFPPEVNGEVTTERRVFPGDRSWVQLRASYFALDLLRRALDAV